MWVRLRNTARRGFCSVPETRLRTRAWRRMRACRVVASLLIVLSLLLPPALYRGTNRLYIHHYAARFRPVRSFRRSGLCAVLPPLAGLTGLAADELALVAHALAQVGLRR